MSLNIGGNEIRATGSVYRITLDFGEGVIITPLLPEMELFDAHGQPLRCPLYRINLLEIRIDYIAKIERIKHGWRTLWEKRDE
jgi:hypothetical protein